MNRTTSGAKPSQNQTNRAALKFIQEARAFHESDIERTHKVSKIAWRIAGVCLLISGISVGAVAGLTPLKTAVPFVIRVDNNTGMTDVVTTLKQSEKSYGEVTDKYFLAQYVRYREGYDWQTVQDTFDATNLLSAPPVQQQFAQFYKDSPNAPYKMLRNEFKVNVRVNAIAFVGKMAQVRFEKVMIPLGTDKVVPQPQRYIATIAYEYKNAPMDEAARLVNPLGFQVTSYRVDKETVE